MRLMVGLIVVGMSSAEDCYRNVRRYSAGVMPVARRNARVKLDCEENRDTKRILAYPGAYFHDARDVRSGCFADQKVSP
jgi:hypothetical protein